MSENRFECREMLWKLIKGTGFCMFVTRHQDGHLHARPMTTQNRAIDEDDCPWFVLSRCAAAMRSATGWPPPRST